VAARLDDGENDGITDINVTPLVDVMLVLLVIFMVTASLIFTKTLPIELPKSSTKESPAGASWQVMIGKNRGFALNGKIMSKAELAGMMKREAMLNPALKVDVAADKGLPYGLIVETLDLLKEQGVRHVVLSVKPR